MGPKIIENSTKTMQIDGIPIENPRKTNSLQRRHRQFQKPKEKQKSETDNQCKSMKSGLGSWFSVVSCRIPRVV